MQYTRRRVSEIDATVENADDTVFQDEIDPSRLIYSVSYRDSYINTPWEDQEEQLAWLLLNTLFAIYEGWAQRLYSERFESKGYNDRRFIKNLQFEGLSGKFTSYYAISGKRSDVLANTYFDVYKNACRLDFAKLENYMRLYR